MKKQTLLPQIKFDPTESFKIKNPKWAFLVCLLATIGGLITFFVFLYLEKQNLITKDKFYVGYIFLGLALVCAVGVYWCVYEKFVYSNLIYRYNRPFRGKRFAKVQDIEKVKILTVYFHTKYGIKNNIKVFFYDKHKNVLIKINDDGTVSKNELFLKSLKVNRIKIVREEKYDW